MKKRNEKNSFSLETIRRLSIYLRNLKRLKDQNTDVISSDKLTKFLNVSPEQFRKDLSFFGGFGKRGVGYNVERLAQEIESILGLDQERRIAIVGIGRLGSALLGFEGFSKFKLKITLAFDIDEDKIRRVRQGVKIRHVKQMQRIIRKENIKIAIISTPPEVAQKVADGLVSSGIKGILNFAPIVLKVSQTVSVSNVDMASELESLIFLTKRRQGKNG
ncbi:MAG: redox-sensing transcriptional repressor Rex [Candidatus Omnitrophota bacterium]